MYWQVKFYHGQYVIWYTCPADDLEKNNRIPDRSFYIRQYATVIALFSGFGINSFAELQSEKEELEKKYIHVLQILESEKTAKWQLLQQCEEQAELVSSLKTEVLYKHKFIIIN